MILLVNIAKERLHYYEFVLPIETILKKEGRDFYTKNYLELEKKDFEKAEKIIICGTSLKDFEFYKNLKFFNWLEECELPVLGICGGAQIIFEMYGEEVVDNLFIGLEKIHFDKKFLSLEGEVEIYSLHQKGFGTIGEDFQTFASAKNTAQVIKHKDKPFYGVLFHPETRNKEMIVDFIMNG